MGFRFAGGAPELGSLPVVWRGGGGFSLLPRRVIVAARTARVKAMLSPVMLWWVALTRAVRAAVWRLSGKGGEWLRSQRALWAFGPLRPQAAGSLPLPLVSSWGASPLRDGSGHEVPATGQARGEARPCGSRPWRQDHTGAGSSSGCRWAGSGGGSSSAPCSGGGGSPGVSARHCARSGVAVGPISAGVLPTPPTGATPAPGYGSEWGVRGVSAPGHADIPTGHGPLGSDTRLGVVAGRWCSTWRKRVVETGGGG